MMCLCRRWKDNEADEGARVDQGREEASIDGRSGAFDG